MDYVTFQRDDGSWVGGMMDMREHADARARSRRTGSSTSPLPTPTRRSPRRRRPGATSPSGPIDIPFGRFAVMTDPNGSAFAVMQLSHA